MKIAFIDPPGAGGNNSMKCMPNHGYVSMATYLRKSGYQDTCIIDAPAWWMNWEDLSDKIKELRPDIVATSSITIDIFIRMRLMQLVKKINPSIITIMGGHHASLVPEEVLRVCTYIDYVVIGEGEGTILELVRVLEGKGSKKEVGAVKGVGYLDANHYIFTGRRALFENLSLLPLPDYSLVPVQRYRTMEFPGNPYNSMQLIFTRGCYYQCTFCSLAALWNSGPRSIDVKGMVEEIKFVHYRYKKNNFFFADNDFFYDRNRSVEFLDELMKSKIRINYGILSRTTSVLAHKDLLPHFYNSGLVRVKLGIESFSQRHLDAFNKKQTVAQNWEAMECLRKARIPVIHAYIVYGLYDEKRTAFIDILFNAYKMKVVRLEHTIITPMPGTLLFKNLKEANVITNWDYRRYNHFLPVVRTKYLTTKQLTFIQFFMQLFWAYFPLNIYRNLFNRARRYNQFVFYPHQTARLVTFFLREKLRRNRVDLTEQRFFLRTLEYIKRK